MKNEGRRERDSDGHEPLRVLTSERVKGRSKPPHLFTCWSQAIDAINSAKQLALFLDFDGTLVPLRRRPSDVQPLGQSLRRRLRRLGRLKNLNVWIISGRPLRKLKELAPVPDVQLLGLHGWEGRATPPLDEERRLVRQARRLLDQRLPKDSHLWVQDKGLGLSIHYRETPQKVVQRARQIVREILRKLGPQIHIVRGHKVWELLPRQIDGKGSAVIALLSKLPEGTLPIVVGDDISDEKAFKVISHGLAVRVGGSPRTRAKFFLHNPNEVKIFLRKLEEELV